jgi:hypothetical protein
VEGYPGEGFQADEGTCCVVARMSLHGLIGSGLENEGLIGRNWPGWDIDQRV